MAAAGPVSGSGHGPCPPDAIDSGGRLPYHPAMTASPLDVLVIGEAIVDFVPLHRGPLRETEGFELHSGGAPANVAIGVSRLGGRAGLVSAVGDDEFGAFLLGALAREAVDTRSVHRVEGARTALCFITLDRHGERSFLHRGGDPILRLAPEHIDPAAVAGARVVKFSGGPLRSDSSAAAVERLLAGCSGLIACDPGDFKGAWAAADVVGGRLDRALGRCHVVKCSAPEALDLTGVSDPLAAARRLVERGVELAVVTLGPEGAVYARARDSGHVPAPAVEVVDTTGAGDAFMAALLLCIARDEISPAAMGSERLQSHLERACAVGAGAVTRRGAIAGLPPRAGYRAGT